VRARKVRWKLFFDIVVNGRRLLTGGGFSL